MAIEAINSAKAYESITPVTNVSNSKSTQSATSEQVTDSASEVVTESNSKKTIKSEGISIEESANNAALNSAQQTEKLKKAVEELNKKSSNSEAIFGIHEATHRVMIKIVDKETKEVIKEFPPEKTLDMIAKAWELAGIMVDEKR